MDPIRGSELGRTLHPCYSMGGPARETASWIVQATVWAVAGRYQSAHVAARLAVRPSDHSRSIEVGGQWILGNPLTNSLATASCLSYEAQPGVVSLFPVPGLPRRARSKQTLKVLQKGTELPLLVELGRHEPACISRHFPVGIWIGP